MNDDFEPEEQAPESFLMISIVLELGLGAVAILLGSLFGGDPRALVPDLSDYRSLAIGIGFGILGALPIVLAVQLLERLPLQAIRDLQEATEERLLRMMIHFRTTELALVSMCAGVGEEMLFRGWLMMIILGPIAQADPMMAVWAIGISSLAFGFAHPISPLYIIVTALMGIYFGVLLYWSENLLVPIVAHGVYDFVELVLATRAMRRREA